MSGSDNEFTFYPTPACGTAAPHSEHSYGDLGNFCTGVYPVLAVFGQWRVITSPEGVEDGWVSTSPWHVSKPPTYDIGTSSLFDSDWEQHMSEKTWVVMRDLNAAIRFARAVWKKEQP